MMVRDHNDGASVPIDCVRVCGCRRFWRRDKKESVCIGLCERTVEIVIDLTNKLV